MTSTLSRLLSGRAAAESKIRDIARLDAGGKLRNGSDKDLPELLARAGWSEAQYSELVEFFHEITRLETEASRLSAAQEASAAAARAVDEHRAETERLRHQRKAELHRLIEAQAARDAEARNAQRAAERLDALRVQFPERFGAEPVDLDTMTPTYCGSRLTIRDDDAPTIGVSAETYERECRRRGAILEHYRQRARAAFNSGPVGMRMPGVPSWGEIVRRGWHKEFAR